MKHRTQRRLFLLLTKLQSSPLTKFLLNGRSLTRTEGVRAALIATEVAHSTQLLTAPATPPEEFCYLAVVRLSTPNMIGWLGTLNSRLMVANSDFIFLTMQIF